MIRNSINNDDNPLNLIYTKNYTNYNRSKSQKCSPEPDFLFSSNFKILFYRPAWEDNLKKWVEGGQSKNDLVHHTAAC